MVQLMIGVFAGSALGVLAFVSLLVAAAHAWHIDRHIVSDEPTPLVSAD